MATTFEPPAEQFRLSMLLYDTRYRSLTIQIIVLISVLLAFGWLINNVITNFADRGKTFSFSFLGSEAFYDIPQHLIEYDSTRTHMRAAVVGLLNTLLVAFIGCVLATVIGTFVGILRLSSNWLIARLMTIYVEMFRNVPVLLWIVLIHAVLSETLPQPRDFIGDDPKSLLFDSIAMTRQGTWMPQILFSNGFGDIEFGTYFGVSIELLIVIAVLMAAWFVARKVNAWADQTQAETGDRPTTWYAVLAIWFVPLLVVLWWMGFYLDGPELTTSRLRPITGGTEIQPAFISLTLALSLYTAAFIAEIVRGGILAVSKGQTEAAYALGVQPGHTMRLVILPQALRVIIPPMISNYLNLTKNSSLAIAVGYADITGTLAGITLNQTGREMESLLLLMAFYLAISLSISAVMNWYNDRVKLKER